MEWRLFLRWLASCAIDYGLLIAAILFFALHWPGGGAPLGTVALNVLAQLLYQPLGELLGGTIGQRLAGIRLIAPGVVAPVSITTIIRRHAERIGVFWGLFFACRYWWERLRPQAAPIARADRMGQWEWGQRCP